MKFPLGQVVVTRNALETLSSESVQEALRRHASGEWGDLDDEDKQENELSLKQGFRLFSAYNLEDERVYAITEADRSVTTILLAEDY